MAQNANPQHSRFSFTQQTPKSYLYPTRPRQSKHEHRESTRALTSFHQQNPPAPSPKAAQTQITTNFPIFVANGKVASCKQNQNTQNFSLFHSHSQSHSLTLAHFVLLFKALSRAHREKKKRIEYWQLQQFGTSDFFFL